MLLLLLSLSVAVGVARVLPLKNRNARTGVGGDGVSKKHVWPSHLRKRRPVAVASVTVAVAVVAVIRRARRATVSSVARGEAPYYTVLYYVVPARNFPSPSPPKYGHGTPPKILPDLVLRVRSHATLGTPVIQS